MKKPTLRRSGEYMITVSITHHLTGADVAAILITNDRADERLTKREAERAIRQELALNGGSLYPYWRDNLTEDEQDDAWEWATEEVRRLFPDLLDVQ